MQFLTFVLTIRCLHWCRHGQSHDSWEEALCSELLYKYPTIHESNISIRAEAVMTNFRERRRPGKTSNLNVYDSSFQHIVLAIMTKSADKALQALHSFGGGSGAAMPATMVCGKTKIR